MRMNDIQIIPNVNFETSGVEAAWFDDTCEGVASAYWMKPRQCACAAHGS